MSHLSTLQDGGMAPVNPRDIIDVGTHVVISNYKVFENHLQMEYTLDKEHKFLTKVLYPTGVLSTLRQKYPVQEVHRIFCNIALIEALKFIATFPETLDISLIADGLTQGSLDFFTKVASHAWTQHYYENCVADYFGPKFIIQDGYKLGNFGAAISQPASVKNGPVLCSNGGGKDSFLAAATLQEAGFDIGIFQHARSEYGRFDYQHDIQKKHIKHLKPLVGMHEISIYDDFTDGTIMSLLNPRLKGDCTKGYPCQVGWPEMVFESIPFYLLGGYCGFSLGNERSADSAQGEWSALSGARQINHQWLKSYEACTALQTFLSSELIQHFQVFSLLKPIHDYRIYKDLAKYPQILPDIHSCNIVKPWCKRCSKCCYVFVNLVAVFGFEPIVSDKVFGENLFNVSDNVIHFRHLLGMEKHNAWECVGETGETRLAFRRSLGFGCTGLAIDLFKENFALNEEEEKEQKKIVVPWKELIAKYDRVYEEAHGIPQDIFSKVQPLL